MSGIRLVQVPMIDVSVAFNQSVILNSGLDSDLGNSARKHLPAFLLVYGNSGSSSLFPRLLVKCRDTLLFSARNRAIMMIGYSHV